MLACNHTGTAGTTQRVCHKTVRKAHSLIDYAIQVGSFHVARIITAHHLCRMVIGHDIHNIILLLLLLVGLLTGCSDGR